MALTDKFEDLGPNSGLVEEMYRQFLENPSSVSASWREFFADYSPRGAGPATGPVPIVTVPPATTQEPTAPAMPATAPAPTAAPDGKVTKPVPGAPLVMEGETAESLRGAAARVVDNMEASLGVPTATSVRTVAA
jgi:2-oxoglutarate dehydrogenase complex dehydrogenase (E1) component-like enzyme